jgi:outer membrane protein TolC
MRRNKMRNKMRKAGIVFLTAFSFLFSGLAKPLFPQEKIILTLEKSIDLALSQNPQHQATKERVDAASARVKQAASGFLPSLNGQGFRTVAEKPMELEFPSFIPGEPPQRVKVDFTRDYQFAMSLQLPLFTGGKLTSIYRQARQNLELTKEAVRQSEFLTVFNTKRAFFGYLLAKEFVSVAEEAVNVAEQNLKNVKNMYEVGMATKMDLLRSEVQLTNLQPQLIQARNNLRMAELGLKILLGLDLSQEVEIRGELTYEPFEPEVDKCISQALFKRPEVCQLDFQLKMAGESLKLARSQYLPTVAIAGSYNFWADKFNFKEGTWQNYYAINLALTIPIFNGFRTSAQIGESKAMIRQIELTQKALEEAVELEVRQAVLLLNEAKESLLSQEKNIEQAKESLRITQLNFSEGMATSLDVFAAEAAYSQARTNYAMALYDYSVALAQLEKAVGSEIQSLNAGPVLTEEEEKE